MNYFDRFSALMALLDNEVLAIGSNDEGIEIMHNEQVLLTVLYADFPSVKRDAESFRCWLLIGGSHG